jgi:hypothetical protein
VPEARCLYRQAVEADEAGSTPATRLRRRQAQDRLAALTLPTGRLRMVPITTMPLLRGHYEQGRLPIDGDLR